MRSWWVPSAVAVVGIAVSCGSSGDSTAEGGGASAGTGAFGQGGTAGVLNPDGGGGNAGTEIPPDAACATETATGSLKSLAMYVLLDRSGSMSDNNKWDNARAALSQFVDEPNAAGIKFALGYFPNPGADCDGTGYRTPAVPMDVLPNHADAVNTSLQTTQQTSLGTPTEGALNGIRGFCRGYANQHPTEKIVGVLVTDGEPNGCDETTAALTAIAASAFNGDPSVPVFAIGMEGANFTLLDQIADSGGSQQSFNVSQGGATSFLDALETIAGTSLPCEFAMPTGTNDPVDPRKVNVKYTNAAGDEQFLGQVNGPGDCVPNAWYYDDPANPTQFILCPETCTEVRGESSGQIDIVLGCQTIAPPPPR